MRQLSKHDVNKLTALELKDKLPFELVSDGEIVAVVLPYHDVNKLHDVNRVSEAKHDVNKADSAFYPQRKHKQSEGGGLRFSKSSQAAGRMR